MSLDYILNLPGLSRYDVHNCIIVGNQIHNWQHTKSKLQLTDEEVNKLYKEFKKEFNAYAKEQQTKNGVILTFTKNIIQDDFNNFMRKFITNYKICKNCNMPELLDGNCNACTYSTVHSNNIISIVTDIDTNTTDKKKLTTAEKAELKKQKQRENAKKI